MRLKSRPQDKGVIVVASNIEQLKGLINLSTEQWQLIQSKPERPTTWICEALPSTSKLITGRFNTVAVRLVEHPVVQGLCDAFGGPIVSTSANPSGEKEALTIDQVKAYFGDKIKVYAEGELGKSSRPSRIIDIVSKEVLRD